MTFFDSELVYTAIPYLVTAWALGFGFGWVYAIFKRGFSSWTN